MNLLQGDIPWDVKIDLQVIRNMRRKHAYRMRDMDYESDKMKRVIEDLVRKWQR